MQQETIIQAFSRTNRIFGEDKPVGTIYYYRYPYTMKANIEEAVKIYAGDKAFMVFVDKLDKNLKATTLFVVFLFVHSWEQRKFEDAFIERREKTVTENEDTLLSCAINGMFLNSELFGHFRGTTTIGYLKVKKNDLILSAQNLHLGNANVNLRFEHGIISPAYKVYDLNNCEPEFVQAWVKKEDTKNFFLAATTEGASQCRKNIEWDTLGKQAPVKEPFGFFVES